MNIRDYMIDDADFDVETTAARSSRQTVKTAAANRTTHKKRAKAPQQFNGIHRRRRKKIRW